MNCSDNANTDTDTDTDTDITTTTTTTIKDIGIANIPGTDPDRANKINQDAHFSISISPDSNESSSSSSSNPSTITCVGVLDGHGTKGHVVSQFIAQRLPQRIEELILDSNTNSDSNSNSNSNSDNGNKEKDKLKHDLIQAFEMTHEDAKQDTSIPAGRSGTTCVMCAVQKKTTTTTTTTTTTKTKQRTQIMLHLAHVGDSRAILGYSMPSSSQDFQFQYLDEHNNDNPNNNNNNNNNNGNDNDNGDHSHNEKEDVFSKSKTNKWTSAALTTETNVKIPTEKSRIEAGEGRIDAMGNVFYGPVGIAMTRALGDAVMLRAGVIPTPVVDRYFLDFHQDNDNEDDKVHEVNDENDEKDSSSDNGIILVLGSDGIFDVMTNQEVVDLAAQCLSSYNNHNKDGNKTKAQWAAEQIAQEAKTRWQAGLPMDVKSDDITCALVVLH